MTNAVKQACHTAFDQDNLARIFAAVYSYNKESCKVLEKCGFELEGVLKKSVFKNGQIFDSYMYAVTK